MSKTGQAASETSSGNFVVAACGLALEARIAAGPDVQGVVGGLDPGRLANMLAQHVARGARAIASFGIAGGLAPQAHCGAWIIGRGVVTPSGYRRCDERWIARLVERLPGAKIADVVGVDVPVAQADAKRALHGATAAFAIDTESHVVARIAAAHGLPFAVFRVIADGARRDLPAAATVALDREGIVDVKAVLRSLAATPSQLPLLLRTALDARSAFASLLRGRRRLGPGLGCDLRALELDVL